MDWMRHQIDTMATRYLPFVIVTGARGGPEPKAPTWACLVSVNPHQAPKETTLCFRSEVATVKVSWNDFELGMLR